jgi:hypothetical protein
VVDDHDAISRQVDVQLQAVGASRHPALEGGKGVFRAEGTSAAMGEDERTGMAEERHKAQTQNG